jgi:hypothetical protein
MEIKTVKAVEILPTRVWIESRMFGQRVVVVRHEGLHAFDYAVFNYDCAYTSNAGTLSAAEKCARSIGATLPIEHKSRALPEKLTKARPVEQKLL